MRTTELSSLTILLAAISLVPAMVGPLSGGQGRQLSIALCGGGSVSIPFEGAPAPGDDDRAHCAEACHAGRSRECLDNAQ